MTSKSQNLNCINIVKDINSLNQTYILTFEDFNGK